MAGNIGISELWDQLVSLKKFRNFAFDNISVRSFEFEEKGVCVNFAFYYKYIPVMDDEVMDGIDAAYTAAENLVFFPHEIDKKHFTRIISFVQQYNLNIIKRSQDGNMLVIPCTVDEYKTACEQGRACKFTTQFL